MLAPTGTNRALAIQLLLLSVALGVLAVMQYRWIGRITDAERQRTQNEAEFFARGIADEVGRELRRAFQTFLGTELGDVAPLYESWRENASHPELISAVYVADRNGEDWTVSRMNLETFEVEPAEWPDTLAPMTFQLQYLAMRGPNPGWPDPLFVEVPGMFIVQRPEERTAQFLIAVPLRVILLQFDRKVLTGPFVPDLTRGLVPQGAELPYDVALVAGPQVIHRTAGWREGLQPDATAMLPRIGGASGPPRGREPETVEGLMVQVRHRDGGVDSLVTGLRRRNLAVSAGILLILVASMAMLVALIRRGERVRAQEAAFVRVMTHELNTPVAVLRSAGENLKDGIVDRELMTVYGATIVEEADRLHHMIGEVLELAGLQAKKGARPMRSIALEPVIAAAVERCRLLTSGRTIEIETFVEPGLPPVAADDESLTRAIENLIINAIRHGGAGGWVGVRAAREGQRVAVTVEDRGPGIPDDDLEQLFDPFYRGRESGNVIGAGLGLTIVRQIAADHGGSVTLDRRDAGAAFTIHLPTEAGRA